MEELNRVIGLMGLGLATSTGAPEQGVDLWAATALLAATVPIIIVVTGYFDFWPLKRR